MVSVSRGSTIRKHSTSRLRAAVAPRQRPGSNAAPSFTETTAIVPAATPFVTTTLVRSGVRGQLFRQLREILMTLRHALLLAVLPLALRAQDSTTAKAALIAADRAAGKSVV